MLTANRIIAPDANRTVIQRHLFVLKTDGKGTLLWQRSFGDVGYNYGKFGIQLKDGRLVVAGALSEEVQGKGWSCGEVGLGEGERERERERERRERGREREKSES